MSGPEDPRPADSGAAAGRVAGGALVALVGGVAAVLMTTAYQVVIARALGTSRFGIFFLALTLSVVVGQASVLGLDYGVLRFGAIKRVSNGRPGVRAVARSALVASFATGTAGATLLILCSHLLGAGFGKPDVVAVLIPLALAVPFTSTAEVARAGLRVDGRAVASVASASLVNPAIQLATGIWAVSGGRDPVTVAWAYTATEVLTLLLTLGTMRALLHGQRTEPAAGLFKFSVPMSLNRVLLYTNNQTEIVVLGILRPAGPLGIFAVAKRLALPITALLTAVGTLFNPIVAELHHAGEQAELDRLFKISTRWLFTLGLPVCLFELLFPAEIIRFFGRGFASGAPVLAILAFGQLINVATGSVATMLAMAGRSKLSLLDSAAFLIMSLILDFALIPRWGILGAAVANSATVVAINALRVVQVKRILRVTPYDRRYLRPAVAGLVSGALARFVPLPFGGGHLDLLVRLAILGFGYVGVLAALGIEPVDREVGRDLRARMRRRRGKGKPEQPAVSSV